jgi:hypothetical protein
LDSSTRVGNDNAIGSQFRNRQQAYLFYGSIRIALSLVLHDSNPTLSYRPISLTTEPIEEIPATFTPLDVENPFALRSPPRA